MASGAGSNLMSTLSWCPEIFTGIQPDYFGMLSYVSGRLRKLANFIETLVVLN